MRLVKVRIRAGDITKSEDQLMYPARYSPYEVDQHGGGTNRLNDNIISMSGEIGRGGSEEFMFITLPDALAQEYAADPDMMIVDSNIADTEMETNRVNNGVPEELVYPDIINAIKAKQDAKIPLSQANLDALDFTKPEKGINRSRKPVLKTLEVNDDLTGLPTNLKSIQRK